MEYKRPTKDEYYLDLAGSVSKRGTCTKVEIGAVIIRDDQVLASGYGGEPRGTKSSHEHGFCLRKKLGIPSGHRYEMCRSVHAEQNAIIQAAYHGASIKDATLFCTNMPCSICAKMIINAGIRTIYYLSGYADVMSEAMRKEAGVDVPKLETT